MLFANLYDKCKTAFKIVDLNVQLSIGFIWRLVWR